MSSLFSCMSFYVCIFIFDVDSHLTSETRKKKARNIKRAVNWDRELK